MSVCMSMCALNANKSPGCGRGPTVDPSPPHVLQRDLECDVGPQMLLTVGPQSEPQARRPIGKGGTRNGEQAAVSSYRLRLSKCRKTGREVTAKTGLSLQYISMPHIKTPHSHTTCETQIETPAEAFPIQPQYIKPKFPIRSQTLQNSSLMQNKTMRLWSE